MTKSLIKPSKESMEMSVNSGLSAKRMSDKYNCSHPTVTAWLKEYGLHKPRPELPPAYAIQKLINNKMAQPVIAERLDIGVSTLSKLMRQYGLKTAEAIKMKEIQEGKAKTLEILKDGPITSTDLAEKAGYPMTTISRWLNKFKKDKQVNYDKFTFMWSAASEDISDIVDRNIDIKLIPFSGDIPQCGFIVEHRMAA